MAKLSSTWDTALSHFRPLIIAQGEVGYAYNLLQESFFGIFVLAMNLERNIDPMRQPEFYPYALSIWHVLQNDTTQRQLALTAIEKLPTKLDVKGGIARLEWAKRKADQLAQYRNLIIHAPMKFWFPWDGTKRATIPVPSIGGASTKHANIRRLRFIKSTRFWKALRNDFLNLNDYVELIGRQIGWREYERRNGAPVVGALRSWPHRPKLRSVRQIFLIEQAVKNYSPKQPPASRKRRRPSQKPPRG